MFRSRVFWKLYIGFVILILLTALTVGTLISQRIEQDELRKTEQTLRSYATMLSDTSGASLKNSSPAVLQERVRILSGDLAVRLTLIRLDGVVLADSDENPLKMDNHADRPEVLAARANGVGTSTRFSNTARKRQFVSLYRRQSMMYVVLPVHENNETVGYARAALPISEIDQRLAQIRNIVIFGAGLGAVIALLIGLFFARQVVRPLHKMTALANSIAGGNYEQRVHVPVRAHNEFGELARALNTMAAQVEHDITERERTEREKEQLIEQLRNAEARYQRIAANVPGMVYQIVLHPNHSIDFPFVSEGCNEIFNLQPEEIMHNPALPIKMVDPEDRAGFKRSVAESAETLLPWRWEGRLNLPSGEQKWIQGASRPARQADGSVLWDGLLMDITEGKRAEEALRKSEEYHNLFRHANDAILIFDPEGEIVLDANDQACEVYGIVRDDFIGRSLKEMSKDVLRGEQHLEALLSNRTNSSIETTHFRGDGTPINFLINLSLIEFQGQRAVLSINRDITEHKRAEESLRQSEEQLRQSQKMESIGTLAGGVAHDFNNLLTAIIGYSDLSLRRLEEGSPLHRNISEVKKAGERAAKLTRQLLAFSRRQQLERKIISLNETITDIMKMLNRIIGEDVEVRFSAAANLTTVFADPGQMEQVVMNLAVNARDAMPDGGKFIIETHNVTLDALYCHQYSYAKPGRYVRIMVSDTGAGMDAATRERIFEPFFTTKEIGKGTGLGLSMVYGIVKQHDGFIEVYSEVGEGTTFKLYLPVEERVVKNEPADVRPALQGGAETILVAEDEEGLGELARNTLEELGYAVLVAADGAEAVEIYRAKQAEIDLVILDVVMPRMSGHEAYDRMHALAGRPVPLIYMTGYSAEMVQSKLIKEGNAALLQKPYSLETLGRRVREVLDEARRADDSEVVPHLA